MSFDRVGWLELWTGRGLFGKCKLIGLESLNEPMRCQDRGSFQLTRFGQFRGHGGVGRFGDIEFVVLR